MIIRPMELSDAGKVTEIGKQSFSHAWSYQAVCDSLNNPHERTYVCCEAEELYGFLNIACVLDEGGINNIAVSPEHRRKGVGDLLLDHLDEEAKKLGLSFMTLEVRVSNAPAIALYEKHGFKNVGLRKRFYTKPVEDAVLMTKFYTEEANG